MDLSVPSCTSWDQFSAPERSSQGRFISIRAILVFVTLDQSVQGQRRIEKSSCLRCAYGVKDVRVKELNLHEQRSLTPVDVFVAIFRFTNFITTTTARSTDLAVSGTPAA
jgi:hypothetical protein